MGPQQRIGDVCSEHNGLVRWPSSCTKRARVTPLPCRTPKLHLLMPTSRLVFRIDLALALTFVAFYAYARHVERRQIAPLASGPPIEQPIPVLSPAPVPTAIIVAATTGKADIVRRGHAKEKLRGAPRSTGLPATISSPATPATSEVAGTPLTPQVEIQQRCANGSASCSLAAA